MSRRRNVVAPQLLRQIVAIAIYLILGARALKLIFDYDVKTALTGGAVLAAGIGPAPQDTPGKLFFGVAPPPGGGLHRGGGLPSRGGPRRGDSGSRRATRERGLQK